MKFYIFVNMFWSRVLFFKDDVSYGCDNNISIPLIDGNGYWCCVDRMLYYSHSYRSKSNTNCSSRIHTVYTLILNTEKKPLQWTRKPFYQHALLNSVSANQVVFFFSKPIITDTSWNNNIDSWGSYRDCTIHNDFYWMQMTSVQKHRLPCRLRRKQILKCIARRERSNDSASFPNKN